jgi:hypothetical protein
LWFAESIHGTTTAPTGIVRRALSPRPFPVPAVDLQKACAQIGSRRGRFVTCFDDVAVRSGQFGVSWRLPASRLRRRGRRPSPAPPARCRRDHVVGLSLFTMPAPAFPSKHVPCTESAEVIPSRVNALSMGRNVPAAGERRQPGRQGFTPGRNVRFTARASNLCDGGRRPANTGSISTTSGPEKGAQLSEDRAGCRSRPHHVRIGSGTVSVRAPNRDGFDRAQPNARRDRAGFPARDNTARHRAFARPPANHGVGKFPSVTRKGYREGHLEGAGPHDPCDAQEDFAGPGRRGRAGGCRGRRP